MAELGARTTPVTARAAEVKERIGKAGVVAVLRAPDAKHFKAVAEVLINLGVTAIEITLTARNALDALATITRERPPGVVVGAGSVLTERDAAACVQAGAEFLVAPALVPDVVRFGLACGIPVYPGALTASEFVAANALGVDLVKLFPAGVMGPGYLKDLKGPLPGIDVMPTGGIALEDVSAWLKAGAFAVGLGGPMLGDSLAGGSFSALRRRVGVALDEVSTARIGK